MESLPHIRRGLLRHELDGQVLVYDSRDDRVHLLDPTTGCVLELLQEGGWTHEGVTAELGVRLNVAPDPALLALALEELRTADLLDEAAPVPTPMIDENRRAMLRKLAFTGAAAALVPAIASLTATAGYAQGSLGGVGTLCSTNSQCASGRCCGGQCRTAACTGDKGPCAAGVTPADGTTVQDCTCCSGICEGVASKVPPYQCTKP